MKEDIGFIYCFKNEDKRDEFYKILLDEIKEEENTPYGYVWKAQSTTDESFNPYFVVITFCGVDFDYWDNWILDNINKNNLQMHDSQSVWVKQQNDVIFLSKENVGVGNE